MTTKYFWEFLTLIVIWVFFVCKLGKNVSCAVQYTCIIKHNNAKNDIAKCLDKNKNVFPFKK